MDQLIQGHRVFTHAGALADITDHGGCFGCPWMAGQIGSALPTTAPMFQALEDVVSKFEETKHQTAERTRALDTLIKQLREQVQTQRQICGKLESELGPCSSFQVHLQHSAREQLGRGASSPRQATGKKRCRCPLRHTA